LAAGFSMDEKLQNGLGNTIHKEAEVLEGRLFFIIIHSSFAPHGA
jgi:hypothetical protein